MMAFIDESGLPNPNDATSRPVVAAVCFEERHARLISRRIHALKKYALGGENTEIKGGNLLNKNNYVSSHVKRMRAEKFFATLTNLPVTVFATILRGPFLPFQGNASRLENRFRFLLQRVEILAAERDLLANIVFDGLGNRFHELGRSFSNYLFRSSEGQASVHIADSPLFVDSKSASGIQIADMCAYAIRVYQENRLFEIMPPPGDVYLHAARRWYRIIQRLARDLPTSDGQVRHGLHFLPPGIR